MIQKQTQLSNLTFQKPETIKSPEIHRQQLTNLQSETQQLEDKLSRRSAEFRNLSQPITPEAIQKFTEWLENAKSIYTDVISTIRRNLDSICNYFLSRTTNGAMEGINNRLKLIKRQAYGFMNFDNMRNRFLACFS